MFYNVLDFLRSLLLIIFISVIPFSLQANNTPVKSIDASGNVTYSDKPVANAKSVTNIPLQAGPNKSEIEAAQQQTNKNIIAAEEIDQKNQKTEIMKNPQPAPPEEKTIYSGTNNNPPHLTKLKPAIKRPGINPPSTHRPVARPKAGR